MTCSKLDGEKEYLVETSKHVGEVHNRLPVFVHLMEHIVPEQLHNVPITRLTPPQRASESGPISIVFPVESDRGRTLAVR